MSRIMKNPFFCIYAKTKAQISCTLTMQLINGFVLATYRIIVQTIYFLKLKFQASSHLRFVSNLVGNPDDRFSRDLAHTMKNVFFKEVGLVGSMSANELDL